MGFRGCRLRRPTMMVKCSNCGRLLPPRTDVCPNCKPCTGTNRPQSTTVAYAVSLVNRVKKKGFWEILGLCVLGPLFWPITLQWLVVDIWQHSTLPASGKFLIASAIVTSILGIFVITGTVEIARDTTRQDTADAVSLRAFARLEATPEGRAQIAAQCKRREKAAITNRPRVPTSHSSRSPLN